MVSNNDYCTSPPGKYDIAVIGAGSAGFSAAITASELGAKVALIGYGTIGGTCVNVGCVPSKNLIRAAETIHQSKNASRFAGISGKVGLDDWRAVIATKNKLVDRLRKEKYSDLLSTYDFITYIEGAAVLTEGGVAVNGRSIKAEKIIITTGASPSLPKIEGIDKVSYLTSTSALNLKELPKSLLVIGGGYIGCELAQMFSRMGVGVTIVCRSRLLPAGEPEISKALAGYLRDEGISVRDGLEYKEIHRTSGGIALTVEKDGTEEMLKAEQVLITTGRSANTDGLGLKENGIELTERGGIKVDDYMKTTKDGIYAAGDVTGRDQFVYMAAYGAKIAVENAIKGDNRRYDASAMPSVVFTDPQYAGVGLTEKTARSMGFEVLTSTLTLDYVPRALAALDTRGLIKLIADSKTGRLLGAHILAPEGADSIQTAVLAIRHGLTVAELADTIFPYLTTVEGLKLTAQAFNRDIGKLSCCAG